MSGEKRALPRIGFGEVRAGRLDPVGKEVFTLRTFEYLAATSIGVNPYTDDWALIQEAVGGGKWISLFDSALDRARPLIDPDPKSPIRLANRAVTFVASKVHPHLSPVIKAALDLDNIDRVRGFLSRDPGSAARIAHAEVEVTNNTIRIERSQYALWPRPEVTDDMDARLQTEVAILARHLDDLTEAVQDAALAIDGPWLGNRCVRRMECMTADAIESWTAGRPGDVNPLLRLIAMDGGPERFVRDVQEGRA